MRYLHHNIWHGLTIILGISLVVFGCTDTPTQDVTPTRGRPTEIGTKQEGTQASQANNRMAFELFSNLTQNKEDKNFFISPFSISHAIGMVLEGADQKTAEQIREALGIPQDVESEAYHRGVAYLFDQFQYDSNASKVHKEIAKIEKQLADLRAKAERLPTTRASNPKRRELLHEERMLVDNLNRQRSLVDDNECLITNSLWAEKSYIFSATFFENVAKHYGADSVFPADFRNSSDQERKRINDWVSKYTKSKINNAIPPGLLSKLTRLVLVNTIYFNGKWLEPFEKSSTEDQDFHLDAKEVIKVPMMYQYLSECSYAAFNADGSFF
ncbi:MAG: serpin family protein, partial [Planctomycetia bacterium]